MRTRSAHARAQGAVKGRASPPAHSLAAPALAACAPPRAQFIERREFQAYVRRVGWPVTDYEVKKMFDEADKNGDGRLDFAELRAASSGRFKSRVHRHEWVGFITRVCERLAGVYDQPLFEPAFEAPQQVEISDAHQREQDILTYAPTTYARRSTPSMRSPGSRGYAASGGSRSTRMSVVRSREGERSMPSIPLPTLDSFSPQATAMTGLNAGARNPAEKVRALSAHPPAACRARAAAGATHAGVKTQRWLTPHAPLPPRALPRALARGDPRRAHAQRINLLLRDQLHVTHKPEFRHVWPPKVDHLKTPRREYDHRFPVGRSTAPVARSRVVSHFESSEAYTSGARAQQARSEHALSWPRTRPPPRREEDLNRPPAVAQLKQLVEATRPKPSSVTRQHYVERRPDTLVLRQDGTLRGAMDDELRGWVPVQLMNNEGLSPSLELIERRQRGAARRSPSPPRTALLSAEPSGLSAGGVSAASARARTAIGGAGVGARAAELSTLSAGSEWQQHLSPPPPPPHGSARRAPTVARSPSSLTPVVRSSSAALSGGLEQPSSLTSVSWASGVSSATVASRASAGSRAPGSGGPSGSASALSGARTSLGGFSTRTLLYKPPDPQEMRGIVARDRPRDPWMAPRTSDALNGRPPGTLSRTEPAKMGKYLADSGLPDFDARYHPEVVTGSPLSTLAVGPPMRLQMTENIHPSSATKAPFRLTLGAGGGQWMPDVEPVSLEVASWNARAIS